MRNCSRHCWLVLLLLAASAAYAAPADNPPVLRLEAGGPTADVTVLAFSPDGQTLYAAGFDKIVRVWHRRPQTNRFEPAARAYRVPVAPGTAGTINALEVSPDGEWLAVSGLGVWEGEAGFRDNGKVFPAAALSPEMRREQATIYLFQTRAPYAVKVLRHHTGLVVNLRFAPAQPRTPPLLVSLAREPGAQADSFIGRTCLWDITKAAYRDNRGRLVDPGALLAEQVVTDHVILPDAGLAVRHIGPGIKELQVAIAWGDDRLRVWEPDAGKLHGVQDAKLNHTAAYTSDGKILVTGAIDARTAVGRLQPWTEAPGQDPEPAAGVVSLTPNADYAAFVPHALALLPARQKGQPDIAVAALRVRPRNNQGDVCWLLPADLGNARPRTPIKLWSYSDKLPILAASPDGRYVAVSGGPRHEVWVFTADDLLRGQPTKQVLRSVGTVWPSVAFVERPAKAGGGKDVALRLQQAPHAGWGQPGETRRGDLIADFTRRELVPARPQDGWGVASPADQGWKVVQVQGTPPARPGGRSRWVITWANRDGNKQTAVLLGPTERVEDAVVLLPSRASRLALLALAIWDDDHREPSLRIYRTDTGEQVRQYVGHGQRILGLAASSDGKRLASTAADQTVCVWSLADLNAILDRQGSLPGLVVEQQNNGLVVNRVDADCPIRANLSVGDRVERLEIGGKPVPTKSSVDFYDALWNQPRGTRAALLLQHGGRSQTVAFAVGQGIDERHPLFSLFVPAGQGARRPWIGWSPLGWFDASDPDAEQHVGWHFNPKQLEEPATFAPVQTKRYHETFYRRGVLGRLFAGSEAVSEAERPVIPSPRISVEGVRTPGTTPELLGDNRYLVQQQRIGFRLKVDGPSLEKNQVESVTWRIDQGTRHRMDLSAAVEQNLSQDVELPEARGTYTVQVELRTREDTPQVATASCTLLERRPPPRLNFAPDWLRKQFGVDASHRGVVKESAFTLEAEVQPAAGVTVSLEHNGHRTELKPANGKIHQALTLTPGENVLVLRAWNTDVPDAERAAESAVERLLLLYHPEPAPEVYLSSVGLGEDARDALAVQPGQALIVPTPFVHIRADIRAENEPQIEITDAKGHALRAPDGHTIQPAKPVRAKNNTWSLDQPVELQPNRQTVVVRAKTGTKTGTADLVLDYQPPLPDIELLSPVHDATLIEGRDTAIVRPRIRCRSGTDFPFELRADVTNGGKPVPQADGKAELIVPLNWIVTRTERDLPLLHLRPGQNQVRVVVSRGRERSQAIERAVFYRQPPRILTTVAVAPTKEPFAEVTATVVSPSKPSFARVEINGHPEDTRTPEVQQQAAEKAPTWKVRVAGIAVPAEKNTVRLWVGNADGLSLEPYSIQVAGIRPKAAPPDVRITSPAHAVGDAKAQVEFVVHSAVPVTAVELHRPGEPPQAYRKLAMTPAAGGGLELRGAFDVPVREGANQYTVIATNEGGRGQATVELTRPRAAVRLVVEPPASSMTQPELRLRGYVAFRDEDEAARGTANLNNLRVYVNEFLQRPVIVEKDDARGPRFRSWHVDLVLNRPENHLEVVCENLPLDAGRRQGFAVHCDKPVAPATLHLLVVGVDVPDDRLLYTQAFRALQAQADIEHGGLRSPIFQRVIMHPYRPAQRRRVLYDDVHRGTVRTALDSIRSYIHTHGSSNDVVMIYWTGKSPVRDGGVWYLPTSESSTRRPPRETDVAVRELLGGDDETPGARILLLDVPSVSAVAEHMPREVASTHAGVIYYAWSKAQKPLHGLLLAVEKSAIVSQPVSLEDVVRTAQQMEKQNPGSLQVSDNLNALPPFRGLIITRSTASMP